MNRLSLSIRALLFIGVTFLPHFTASAQDEATCRIIAEGKEHNQVMQHLDVLTNRFGGRPIGSDAYDNAAAWMLDQYKQWGIEAHLEEAGELPVGFNRGGWWGRLIGGPHEMTLHFVTPSYTSGTKGIQRGHVLIEPKTEEELLRMKHRLKGAWVLVGGQNSGWPISHTAASDSLRNAIKQQNRQIMATNDSLRRISWEQHTSYKPQPLKEFPGLYYNEMVEAGVLGFIQRASVPLRALYDRAMLADANCNFYNLPQVADIKLDEQQYDEIYRMAKERREFWLEFDIRNYFKLGPVKYHNVVASIKGSKYPDEYVIVSGHLDSYDVGTGAVDCGTGIGPMMEAARLIAQSGANPKRTILFVAFAGEEFGLLGAQAFAKSHAKQLDKVSNLFNRDGGPTPPVGIRVPQAMYDDFKSVCRVLETLNPAIPFQVEVAQPRRKPTQMGGTDASVFAMKGLPTLSFTEKDVKGYDFSYGEIWHTERDIFNKQIPEYQEHTAIVTAVVALGIANLNHQLSRQGLYKSE